jgi:hypothetical protein
MFSSTNEDWNPDYNLLSEKMNNISHGIDLPAEIFSIASDLFNISSGIFSTYDKSKESFFPFSSIGIDQTTLRRCIISRKNLEENNLIFTGDYLYSNVSKTFLKNLVSNRMWDLIENINLLLFNHKDSIFGIMIIFNSEIFDHPQIDEFSSQFIRHASDAFSLSRSKVINNLESLNSTPPVQISHAAEKAASDLENLLKENIDTSFKAAVIDYSKMIDELIEHSPSLDIQVIERDILKMYSSMLNTNGYILRINNNRILIIFTSGIKNDNSIIKNQLVNSLISLFKSKRLLPRPDVFVDEIIFSKSSFTEKINSLLSEIK